MAVPAEEQTGAVHGRRTRFAARLTPVLALATAVALAGVCDDISKTIQTAYSADFSSAVLALIQVRGGQRSPRQAARAGTIHPSTLHFAPQAIAVTVCFGTPVRMLILRFVKRAKLVDVLTTSIQARARSQPPMPRRPQPDFADARWPPPPRHPRCPLSPCAVPACHASGADRVDVEGLRGPGGDVVAAYVCRAAGARGPGQPKLFVQPTGPPGLLWHRAWGSGGLHTARCDDGLPPAKQQARGHQPAVSLPWLVHKPSIRPPGRGHPAALRIRLVPGVRWVAAAGYIGPHAGSRRGLVAHRTRAGGIAYGPQGRAAGGAHAGRRRHQARALWAIPSPGRKGVAPQG